MMVRIGVAVGGTAYFHFGVHLIVAILMSEKCVAFLQTDSNAHRKVIIHVPLQIKHLTRTVVKVVEKPIVKEHKHDGEIIHHHRHSGHVEHDHSHDIRGSPPPSPPHEHEHEHEHRMDEENLPMPTAAASDASSRSRPRPRPRPHAVYSNPTEESITSRKARPATYTRRFLNNSTYDRMPSPSQSPIRRHRYLTAARAGAGAGAEIETRTTPNLYRPRPFSRDPYIRILFRSSER